MPIKEYLKSNKKRAVLIIAIVLLTAGVIPLFILTFHADLDHPYGVKYIQLNSKDGTKIEAILYTPRGVNRGHPGIVVAHGFCGNKQFMQPLCIELVKRGFTVVSIDFRGHGSSEGNLPILRRDSNDLEEDMMAAVRYLKNLGNINDIGLVGHSMGGSTALRVSENNPTKIDAMVSIGMIDTELKLSRISNVLIAIGRYEQIFSQKDGIEFLEDYTGLDEVKIDKKYGDFDDGDATKVVIGEASEHLAEVLDPTIIFETVQWFEHAFNGERASDVRLTVQFHQIASIIALIGVVMLAFLVLLNLSNKFWRDGLLFPEKKVIEETSLKKLIIFYFIGSLIGAVMLYPLTLVFNSVLPVTTGNILYAFLVSTAIGLMIVYYFKIVGRNRKEEMILNIKAMCSTDYKQSLLFGLIAGISITCALAGLMHWSTNASFLTAREVGAVFAMIILFFPFLFIKEFYFRQIQGKLQEPERIKEYFKMVGIGILIDNGLLIPIMILTWQNPNFMIGFIALSLTVVVIFSVIQQFLVTWVYMHSGRNITGSTIFLCILYAWMIVNFFPFGANASSGFL